MKKIFLFFISVISLMFSACTKEDSLIFQLYRENKDLLDEFYISEHNEYVRDIKIYSSEKARSKNVIMEEFNTFEGVVTIRVLKEIYILAASYKDEETANEALKVMLKHNDNYKIEGRIMYADCLLSYLLMYGEPLEKDGILFYELDNGKTLYCDLTCSCDTPRQDKKLEIPSWIDIIGGTFLVSNYEYHMPLLEELTIADSVTNINYAAFVKSPNLKRVKLSTNLLKIESYAFYDVNFEYIVIPKSVEIIEKNAFSKGNIYCEAEYKPSKWDINFATKDAKVYWASEWEYNEEGIPVSIED